VEKTGKEKTRRRKGRQRREQKESRISTLLLFDLYLCLHLYLIDVYQTFKEMPIWQKAMEIAEEIHKITDNLPKKEDYGFTSQIRRAALSIPSNIAEAYGRHHIADKINFYYMSRGSLTETLGIR
jgi:hypothetical protein